VNGIHDMGGMQDMGPIRAEKNEPVFHAPWEGRLFGLYMTLFMDGAFGYFSDRYQIELIPPEQYLRQSYYEHWLTSLVGLLLKSGLTTRAEIDSGRSLTGPSNKGRPLTAAEVSTRFSAVIDAPTEKLRTVPVAMKFAIGQRVRARNINPVGHTRLPRYARGKVGTVERDHGVFAFPDSSSQGLGDKPQHVYSVRFEASELWGQQAGRVDAVHIDMFEDYLDLA